jgi:hypothetical protein
LVPITKSKLPSLFGTILTVLDSTILFWAGIILPSPDHL